MKCALIKSINLNFFSINFYTSKKLVLKKKKMKLPFICYVIEIMTDLRRLTHDTNINKLTLMEIKM